jgi:hypothetical protein
VKRETRYDYAAAVAVSRTRSQAAGDGGARFMRRNAEPGGHIEQDCFDVAVGQCLSRDEAPETKSGQIQAGVALTDRCTQELLFFRSQGCGGVAATLAS